MKQQLTTTAEQPAAFALIVQIDDQKQLEQVLTILRQADVELASYKQNFFEKVVKDKALLLKFRLADTPSKVYKLTCSFNICDPLPHYNDDSSVDRPGQPVSVLDSLIPSIRSDLMRRISPEKEREVLFKVYSETGMTCLMLLCKQENKQITFLQPGGVAYVKVTQTFNDRHPTYTCSLEEVNDIEKAINAIGVSAFYYAFKTMW